MIVTEIKRSVSIPLYGGLLVIVISNEPNTYESAKRYFNIDDELLKRCDAVLLKPTEGKRLYRVVFSKYISPGIIAHEAKHVVNKLFIDLGIELDPYNDEHETYLLSWVVNRIWEVKTKYEKSLNKKSN